MGTTKEEIEDVAEAADELGERMVEALVEETGRDPGEFDVDLDDYAVPDKPRRFEEWHEIRNQ